ncbi:S8 family peptidase [Nesterenkonia populi]
MSRRRTPARLLGLTAAAALTLPLAAAPAQAELHREMQFWLDDYGVTDAWETTEGEGVTIAVIDTGIDGDHPTLESAVVGGTDFSGGGSSSGTPVEQAATEHGTLVASLAAGRGTDPDQGAVSEDLFDEMDDEEWDDWFESFEADLEDAYGDEWEDEIDQDTLDEFYETREFPLDDEDLAEPDEDEDDEDETDPRGAGVIGVAPGADILSASLVLEDPNPYGPGTEEQIAEAVTWAVDQGADIINMSIGSGVQDWPESWDEAFLHAEEQDVLVVAAAGNRAAGHFSVGAPATIPGVLTVAGVDEGRSISEDSSSQGIAVDLAAASEPLVGAMPDGGYARWEGTSGAAPIVSGAAALVMAAHPDLSAREVKHRLVSTADSEGSSGVDPEYGHGVLNAAEAVSGSVPEFSPDDYPTLEDWIRVHRRADDDGADAHEDIPEEAGVEAGPEGEPRDMPQAAEVRGAQDWAGPVALGIGGLLVVLMLTGGVVHLISRRSRRGEDASETG